MKLELKLPKSTACAIGIVLSMLAVSTTSRGKLRLGIFGSSRGFAMTDIVRACTISALAASRWNLPSLLRLRLSALSEQRTCQSS